MRCFECRYCILSIVLDNLNFQCQYWSGMNGKLVEIFKPQNAGCDQGKPKVKEHQPERSNREEGM